MCPILVKKKKNLWKLSHLHANVILPRVSDKYFTVSEMTEVITHKDESRDERGGSSESHIEFGGQCIQKH